MKYQKVIIFSVVLSLVLATVAFACGGKKEAKKASSCCGQAKAEKCCVSEKKAAECDGSGKMSAETSEKAEEMSSEAE